MSLDVLVTDFFTNVLHLNATSILSATGEANRAHSEVGEQTKNGERGQMKKFLIASMGLVAAVVLAASQSSAQIVTFDVAGQGSPFNSTISGVSAGNEAAVTLSRGGGLLGNSAGNSFAATNWNNTATFNQNVDYFSFTVSPNAGYTLTLTDLKYAVNGSGTLPNDGQWGYSLDGGATFTMQPGFVIGQNLPSSLATWDFADFTSAGPVEFRFWAWGTTAINGTIAVGSAGGSGRIGNLTGNDLVLDGTVVPEPSTIALIGFGLVSMLAFGRRRFSRS